MTGIFQSMLAGMRQAEDEQRRKSEDQYLAGERRFQSDEREYMRDRREVTDRREDEDRIYETQTMRPLRERGTRAQVDSAVFSANRLPVVADREDEQYAHDLSRRPVVEGFQDQQARAGISGQILQNRGAQLRNQGAEIAIQQAQRGEELDKLNHENGMLQARLVADHQRAQQEWAPTAQKIATLGMQGRWQDVVGTLTEAYAKVNDGESDTGLRVDDKGNFFVVNPYSGQKIKDLGQGEDGVAAALQIAERYMQSPQQFLQVANQRQQMRADYEATIAKARAEHPERFTETVQGQGGEVIQIDRTTGKATPVVDQQGGPVRASMQNGRMQSVPAVLQETEAVFTRLQKMPGEDDSARWMRAYAMVNQRGGVPIEDAAQKLWAAAYQEALGSSYKTDSKEKDAEARAIADSVVDGFTQRFGGQQQGQMQQQAQGEDFDPDAFLNQF